jgi:hypothetical protein
MSVSEGYRAAGSPGSPMTARQALRGASTETAKGERGYDYDTLAGDLAVLLETLDLPAAPGRLASAVRGWRDPGPGHAARSGTAGLRMAAGRVGSWPTTGASTASGGLDVSADSAITRAHQHAAGARRAPAADGSWPSGRSPPATARGNASTKAPSMSPRSGSGSQTPSPDPRDAPRHPPDGNRRTLGRAGWRARYEETPGELTGGRG